MSRYSSSLVLTAVLAAVAFGSPARATEQAAAIDTSRLGPQVGAEAPPFTGTDQTGRSHSLESVRGPKGTMLVFFRSADW